MNRVCIKDRVCKLCGSEFKGDRFKCPQCRYREVKAKGKFGADYHRKYYQKHLKVDSPLRPEKFDPKDLHRQAALAKQTKRIHAEIAIIRAAGYSPEATRFGDYSVVLQSRMRSSESKNQFPLKEKTSDGCI